MDANSKTTHIKNILRWVVVIALIVAVYFWKKTLIQDAFSQMKELKVWVVLVCTILSVLYVIFDGFATKLLSPVSVWQGIKSAAFCSFYKLVTLGTGGGIAEVLYLSRCGVEAEKGTGIMMIQYSVHKTVVTILGLLSFVFLLIYQNTFQTNGSELSEAIGVSKYLEFVILGSIISILIVVGPLAVLLSKRFEDFVVKILRKALKNKPEKCEKICTKIALFSENGKLLLKDKKSLFLSFFADCAKLLSWYLIPAVIFVGSEVFFHSGVVGNIMGNIVGAGDVISAGDIAFSILYYTATMSLAMMISGVMIAPAGIGTLEYVFSLFFAFIPGKITTASIILYRFFSMIVPFALGIPIVAIGTKAKRQSKKTTSTYF